MDVLRQRSFWGACTGHFCANYQLYVMVTWLPFYLVHERHLAIESMAKTASLYYLVDAASTIVTGWFSDFWIRPRFHSDVGSQSGYGHRTHYLGDCTGRLRGGRSPTRTPHGFWQ